jgi:hypothetical protein
MYLIIFKEDADSDNYLKVVDEITENDLHFFESGWVDIINMMEGTKLDNEGNWEQIEMVGDSPHESHYSS